MDLSAAMDGNERRQHIMYKLLSGTVQIDLTKVYRPRDEDIIIVGPMKTGTTWLQQILHQLRTKGDESFADIYGITWYINNNNHNLDFDLNAEQVCNPRIFKHHEEYGVVKTTKKQKHIVITRNPFDAAYSYTKFINRWFGGHDDIDDDEVSGMIELLHKTKKMGNYRCTSTWWEHRNDPNVMFVFYEDFLKDLRTMVKKIADFVDIHLTDNEFEHVLSLCTFDYMVKNKDKFKGDATVDAWTKLVGVEKWTPKMGMVREDGGKIGQGKNIGPKLKEIVQKIWQETMGQYGFKNYDEMYSKHSYFAKHVSRL